jgi:predicted nuclease of restriction endonuclease-like (RecB) superfamily
MILLYWRIGREIVQRQAAHKWGARVIDQLATDLHSEFPDVRGFSPRNLKYMRKLALTWPDQQIVQQIVAQLPWGQNVTLLDKLQDDGQRLWYARAAIEHGWSRDILVHQIETRLHERRPCPSTPSCRPTSQMHCQARMFWRPDWRII